MPMRPLTWLKLAPVALLPLLAAYAISSGEMRRDLEQRATAALATSGADWASLKLDGRDATLQGDSPSQQAIDAALSTVAGVNGIRKVENAARLVPPAAAAEGTTQ
jgi:osmotically-inducible protein OsmY